MKRLFLVVLSCLLMATMLVACGGTPAETTADTSVTTEDLSKPIPVKVGFIYGEKVADSTTNVSFEIARKEMEKALGVSSCYIESVLVEDFVAAADMLIDEDCNIIVSTSEKFVSSVLKLAKEDKNTYFISFGSEKTSSNVSSIQPAIYEPANVCGIVAAFNSDSNVLGVVADPVNYAAYPVINAYILGAKEITGSQTDVRVNYAMSTSNDQTKRAIDDLKEQGCDVVMVYQTNDYGIRYCEEIGLRVVGNVYNLPEIAPNFYISGFFYHFNIAIIDAVRSVQFRNFDNSVNDGGIRKGLARNIESSVDNCKKGTAKISQTLYDLIKGGKASVFSGEIKNNSGKIIVAKGMTLSHEEALKTEWLDSCVTNVNDFTEPITEPQKSDLVIKR